MLLQPPCAYILCNVSGQLPWLQPDAVYTRACVSAHTSQPAIILQQLCRTLACCDLPASLDAQLGFEANVGALTTAETVTYVPAGTLARQSKRVAPAGGCIKHTVRAGETTYGIAYDYNADAAEVLRNPDNAAAFEGAASLAYPKPGSVLTVCA